MLIQMDVGLTNLLNTKMKDSYLAIFYVSVPGMA